MGYHRDLEASARWLVSIQQSDHGWGLAAGQASSIVNTAEALYVLRCSRSFEDAQDRASEFIAKRTFDHIEMRGPRIRYVAFALFAMSVIDESRRSSELIKECRSWLLEARNDDGGWGTEFQDQTSALFSTFLAMWSLRRAGCHDQHLVPACQWILAKATKEGWSLNQELKTSAVATGYAVLALANSSFEKSDRITSARSFLLQTRHWGTEEEVIAGTVWKHCTFASVVPALISLGELPYSTIVAEAIVYMNKLRNQDGGWNETEPGVGRTVRAQFWCALAFESVYRAFDPAIHVLRLDAERTGVTLSEPDFVTIVPHTRLATILPAIFYKTLTYFCLGTAVVILGGAHRHLQSIPLRVDALAALGFFALAHLLIRRRPRQFPTTARVIRWLVAAVSVVSLVFGVDLVSMVEFVQDIITNVLNKVLNIIL